MRYKATPKVKVSNLKFQIFEREFGWDVLAPGAVKVVHHHTLTEAINSIDARNISSFSHFNKPYVFRFICQY